MTSWVMAVEVTPSELVAVDIDRSTGGGSLRPRRVPLVSGDDGAGPADPVDVLAEAFASLLEDSDPGGARPARLVVATPPDTERRRFEEIAEATALAGLPAPAWLPGPVSLVGDRIAAEIEVGGQSVVLDARGGGLTTWPVRRTASGAEIGSRGPIATGTRLDQLLLGVVRAQLRSLDPAGAPGDDPSPGSRTTGGSRDLRGEAARLRRGIRRARAQLAGEEVDEARVVAEDHEVVVDRGVFDQLVEHALRETLAEVADGPEQLPDPVVHVLVDRATPLARRLAELTAGERALVVPSAPHDGVLGLAALLAPVRSRPTRAASGAQAIRTARAVGSPSAPVAVPAGVGGSGDGRGPDDGVPTPATGWSLPDEPPEAPGTAIPEARLPSTPVQAQHRGALGLTGVGAAGEDDPEIAASSGVPDRSATPAEEEPTDEDAEDRAGEDDDVVPDRAAAGHLVLAGAAAHEVRPASDAPPGGRFPSGGFPAVDPAGGGPESRDGQVPRTAVRARRGPDTAPQPIPEPREAGTPRGVVPVLVVLVVLAVVAAVGVLLVGPDQVGAAFTGLGAGTAVLPTLSGIVSW